MKRALFLLFAISGCAAAPPVTLSSAFDPAEVAWFHQPGSNTILGNAVRRTVGGEARTCAALPAYLVPVSTYARERFLKMYGDADSGFLPATSGFKFADTNAIYQANSRTVRCDAQGNFRFENVPDGDYYVTATVTWGVPLYGVTMHQGGVMMQKVSVRGGETKNIVLSSG